MKRSDLFREYARVIDMCEKFGVRFTACVKYDGDLLSFSDQPNFTGTVKNYTFAIGICEGKPVFVGDVVYDRNGCKWVAGISSITDIMRGGFTWTKPDPYAELKAAQKAGRVIQWKHHETGVWTDFTSPSWFSPVSCYRIKPEPVIVKEKRSFLRGEKFHDIWCTFTDGVLTNVEIVK